MARIDGRASLLIVTPYYASHGGGVERVAARLADGLARLGWKIIWLASRDDRVANSEHSDALWRACPVDAWNEVEKRTGVPFPVWGFRALCRLWTATGKSDIVVVHESLYVSSMFAVVVARLRGRPVVLVQHVDAVPYKQLMLRALMVAGNATWTRVVHALVVRILYISQNVMRHFEGPSCSKKGVLVPNGVDVEFFSEKNRSDCSGRTLSRPKLLFVGRFVEKKGLDIVEKLARARPDLDFAIAGDGPIRPEKWRLPNVQLLGRLDQSALAEQYWAADFLLLPSHGEGFPLVVQEAMAAGIAPLVSSETARALPGVEKHVYSAPVSRDTPDLIETWSRLIDAALVAEKDDERAIARVEFVRDNWSWERCVDSHDKLLREAQEGGGGSRRSRKVLDEDRPI